MTLTPPLPSRRPPWLRALLFAIVLGLLGGLGAARRLDIHRPAALLATPDLLPFYCAGEALRTGHDPYRVEPLRSCEHRLVPGAQAPWVVEPAPFPGYVLALFVVLSYLPYLNAHIVWIALIIATLTWSTILLADLIAVPTLAIFAAFFPSITILSLYLGEPTSFLVAALVSAAVLAEARRWSLCACALGVAMVEPHVALPALVALAIGEPRARRAVVGVIAVLGTLSLATTGVSGTLEYFTAALPAQARSEVGAAYQYSLSTILWFFGVPQGTALALGWLSYIAASAVGIVIALRARGTRLGNALFVLLPTVTAMIGGTFVHIVQISTALPAALVATVASGRKTLGLLALVGLSYSFLMLISTDTFVICAVAVGVAGAMLFTTQRVRNGILTAAASCALVLALRALPPPEVSMTAPRTAFAAPPSAADGNAIAGILWGDLIRINPYGHTNAPRDVGAKFPGWIGLILVVVLAFKPTRHDTTALESATDPTTSASK
ncbi:MAG TPA: glycosyltransferase 87 family protein [Candidatus Baltobacteraceae bacterium]|nr:glycosyltransferase 87 family protein [Candidatus Baltobacteraceae bacterium]